MTKVKTSFEECGRELAGDSPDLRLELTDDDGFMARVSGEIAVLKGCVVV
jgi:hypothetical protein